MPVRAYEFCDVRFAMTSGAASMVLVLGSPNRSRAHHSRVSRKLGGSRNPEDHARINARHGRIVRFKCLSNNIDSHITTDAGAKAPRDHDVHAAAQTHDRYR